MWFPPVAVGSWILYAGGGPVKAFAVALASGVTLAVLGFVFGAPSVKGLLWKHLPTVPTLLGYSPPPEVVSATDTDAKTDAITDDRLAKHSSWKKLRRALDALYEEGQALIEHHWPDPDDREAQKHYHKWERRTADYLKKNLGKSYKAQFRGGEFPVKAALTSMLSPARLRNRIDESLERLSEIIWEYHGPRSPIRAVPRIIGHSYQLEFSNRTGEARIFTVQVSILRQDAVIRGVSGGKSYGATWESEDLHKVEINGGALDYIILAERHVLGSGERRQIRFRFPWLKGDGEPVEAYTDPWKHGDQSRCRVDLRVTVSAKSVYEGNPYRGCFRLTPTAFQAISC